MAIIDRRMNRKYRKSKKLISLFWVIAFTFSLITISFLQQEKSDDILTESSIPAKIGYTTHDPIFIDGNTGFLGLNASTGISWGSGTKSDPYIIEGWEINASTNTGIRVKNANVHFIIRNNYVYDGIIDTHSGIGLGFCRNGIIENCVSIRNYRGISLFDAHYNIIQNNSCISNSGSGIRLFPECNGNIIQNNNVSSNVGDGIMAEKSPRTFIENNTCCNNIVGISLVGSSSTVMRNNTISNNTLWGVYLIYTGRCEFSSNIFFNNGISMLGRSIEVFNTHQIGLSNLVNGKPVVYIKNSNGGEILFDAGQIIIANSHNLTIRDQNIFDTDIGITVAYSSNITIMNNSISTRVTYGMIICESSILSIINNICNGAVYNLLAITGYSHNMTIQYNNFTNSTGRGADIHGNDTLIQCNNFSSNTNGLHLGGLRNILNFNNFTDNQQFGLWLGRSANNTLVWNNTFIDNNGAGSIYDPSHNQARDDRTNNWWNNTDGYGNYWSDWTTPDDVAPFGIVDNPYDINGTAAAKDYYPQTNNPFIPGRPLANAGADQTVDTENEVTFDGSGSTDNVGIVNYTWTFTYEGYMVELFGETPAFIFEKSGVYNVTLTVKDATNLTDTDVVKITVEEEKAAISMLVIGAIIGVIIAAIIALVVFVMMLKKKKP